jgi:nitrate reductase (NAD(P)H)
MMPSYHIGTLDEASKKVLSEGEVQSVKGSEKRSTFLQSRSWTSAVLHAKRIVSWDTRIFTFQLEHEDQTLGLPIGQHLMIRIRDPATKDAIIRSYTPVSDTAKKGYMDVLVKVYFATNTTKGGKMSTAMDALPIGQRVDFKGPIGKFEYLGRGLCSINGKRKSVKRFVMICGGSGITPVFQVFRAVMLDKEDPTHCIVLDGNRLVEDILCKEELDMLTQGNEQRCNVIHTLTKPSDDWTGLKGRINGELVQQHCEKDKETMVLVCGPEALEKSIHVSLLDQGWDDEQLVFF